MNAKSPAYIERLVYTKANDEDEVQLMERTGHVEVEGGRIWYEITGDGPGIPLIVLHGGPGSGHLGMKKFETLGSKRPVVMYDQLGCGQSDRPSDTSLWTTDRFVRELATLREALGLTNVHILGHSWGTMLLADYMLSDPTGVASVTFSSPCLSAPMWAADANRLRLQLPEDVQRVLTECEEQGTTDSDAYREAEKVYMKAFVCRVDVPEEDKKRREREFGKDVYEFMWGPSEFYPTGNLKAYDRTSRLGEIRVPTLFTCGRYDEATPESTGFYHGLVPGSKFEVLEHSSHSPLREEPDTYLRLIESFLEEVETNAPTR